MKKVYINPTTEVVYTETAQMIASSLAGFEGNLDSNDDDEMYDPLSRGGSSLWDDDDEY